MISLQGVSCNALERVFYINSNKSGRGANIILCMGKVLHYQQLGGITWLPLICSLQVGGAAAVCEIWQVVLGFLHHSPAPGNNAIDLMFSGTIVRYPVELAMGGTIWRFNQWLNFAWKWFNSIIDSKENCRKWFNSIFNSKENCQDSIQKKYSIRKKTRIQFKKIFNSKLFLANSIQ